MVVSGPLVGLADGRQVQLRDVELVRVEHLVQRAVERRVGLQKKEMFREILATDEVRNEGGYPKSRPSMQLLI